MKQTEDLLKKIRMHIVWDKLETDRMNYYVRHRIHEAIEDTYYSLVVSLSGMEDKRIASENSAGLFRSTGVDINAHIRDVRSCVSERTVGDISELEAYKDRLKEYGDAQHDEEAGFVEKIIGLYKEKLMQTEQGFDEMKVNVKRCINTLLNEIVAFKSMEIDRAKSELFSCIMAFHSTSDIFERDTVRICHILSNNNGLMEHEYTFGKTLDGKEHNNVRTDNLEPHGN